MVAEARRRRDCRFDPRRASPLGFLSAALEEAGGFTRLVENLNYSAKRLVEVGRMIWPGKFPMLADAGVASIAAASAAPINLSIDALRGERAQAARLSIVKIR